MTVVASGVGGRFTAGDVKASPALMTAAISFIQGYRGDFEFLVRMKEVWSMHHTFTDGQAKGVLNCMNFDPDGMRYITRAKEAEMQKIAQEVTEEVLPYTEEFIRTFERPNLRLVVEPEPPAFFPVKVTWKRFWLTTEGMAKSHHLDLSRCEGTYFRERHVIDFQMVTLCGVRHRSRTTFGRFGSRVWFLTQQPTKPVCQTCEKKMED